MGKIGYPQWQRELGPEGKAVVEMFVNVVTIIAFIVGVAYVALRVAIRIEEMVLKRRLRKAARCVPGEGHEHHAWRAGEALHHLPPETWGWLAAQVAANHQEEAAKAFIEGEK